MVIGSVLVLVAVAAWLLLSPRMNPRLYDRCMFKPNEERGDEHAFRRFALAQSHHSEFFIKNREGNVLHAWLLGELKNAQYVLFYSMGKDGDIPRRERQLSLLLAAGVPVFIYEYSGFGQSQGKPSLQTLCNDAIDAFDKVCSIGFEADQILLYGESLGSAISAHLMQYRTPGGLIIKSGFASLALIAKELVRPLLVYPTWMFPHPRLDTCANLSGTSVPVLVIHGEGDRLARRHHAILLNDAAGNKREILWLPGSRHAYMPPEDEVLLTQGVHDFVDALPRNRYDIVVRAKVIK
jgi:pimeloyl-ACP methyl ester carboxylesterase